MNFNLKYLPFPCHSPFGDITQLSHRELAPLLGYQYIPTLERDVSLKNALLIQRKKEHFIESNPENYLADNATYANYLNPEMGYGLFSKVLIPARTLIGEYSGVLEKPGPYLYRYGFEHPLNYLGFKLIVNAEEKGNQFRLMNHAQSPNIEIIPGHDLRTRSIILVVRSRRPIQPHEQMTFHYGLDYWKGMRQTPYSI